MDKPLRRPQWPGLHHSLQILEPRILLSALTVTVKSGILTITGTSAADRVLIVRKGANLTFSGHSFPIGSREKRQAGC